MPQAARDGGIVKVRFTIKQSLSFASLNSSLYTREPFLFLHFLNKMFDTMSY